MKDFFDGLATHFKSVFDPALVGTKLATILSDMLVASVTFLVFYVVWRLMDRALKSVLRRTRLDATAASFLHTILKYAVLTIGVVTALNAVGINTGAIITSLGIAGLTIGFAARDALSNIISGIFIFWDRPFVIGDLVEVETYYGTVEVITLRSTRVVTPDGKMLAIPNSTMLNSTVASYTNFPHLRLDIDVTIGVKEDIDRVRRIMLDLVRDDPDYMDDPAPQVVVTQLGDYNVTVQLQVWMENERLHVPKRLGLREIVFKAFTEAGVDMPYETFQLQPLEVRSSGDGHASTATSLTATVHPS